MPDEQGNIPARPEHYAKLMLFRGVIHAAVEVCDMVGGKDAGDQSIVVTALAHVAGELTRRCPLEDRGEFIEHIQRYFMENAMGTQGRFRPRKEGA